MQQEAGLSLQRQKEQAAQTAAIQQQQEQAKQPVTPLDQFNEARHRLDAKIRSLEVLTDELLNGPTPKTATEQTGEEQVSSVRQAVCEFPSEMATMAERIDSVVEHLSCNLLGN